MLLDDKNNQVITGKVPESNNIASLRQYLKDGLLTLKTDFLKAPNNTRLFKQHCKLIDRLLINIWEQANIDKRCCLIAVGGYGRSELYPYSDIDLLILIPEPDSQKSDDIQANASINAKLEALVGLLWDIGLNVGHSVRSLSECLHEA